jgi:class 3 adenylate cyclase/tetratricopeptide (TPR) repeat protein
MQCLRCRAENREGRRFCAACGAELAHPCPACGFSNETDAWFCGGCGARLVTAVAPSAPVAGSRTEPTAVRPQTPRYLAERIRSIGNALEGERKQVTVLFADLKGSMELLVDRDPEEARKILDPVLERMMDAVHHYEGTVNQVMGDGIMALFGAPIAHEDHAVRAGYAALRMQEAIATYGDQVERQYGIALRIRVGLNSGEVVVRRIGNDLTMDYSAIGQTTHLAARMEQMASPGTILATEVFARLTEGYLIFKPLGLVAVKGMAEPVEVLQLVDAESPRTRYQAAARGLTRFVGRQSELDLLQRALARAEGGHGQLVAVIGEPGVGKSRLFYRFIDSEPARGWLVLETGLVSYRRMDAYRPVRDLLKTCFQIEDRDDPATAHKKVTDRVLLLEESTGTLVPPLLALLDLALDDAEWRSLDPARRRERILDAVKRVLLGQSRRQPMLLVMENLHWVDAETQAFLDRLIENLPNARILLLVNYRPEYEHSWSDKSYYSQIRLDPLPAPIAEELLGSLIGTGPDLQPLKTLLIERTEGNPFFLEESVRSLLETRVLVGEHGSYRLARSLSSLRVPATVEAILAARIDRLDSDTKRLLQCAAVIGKQVTLPLLQAVAEQPEDDVRRGLAHLRAAEFLHESSLFPELEYTFKHALTLEVAYGGLLQERRRQLHARTVTAIETLYATRLASQVERLANHAVRGELWDKAVAYLRLAGMKAATRSAYREAVACFEQALLALKHLPESPDTLQLAFDLRMELRPWLAPLGNYDRILENLREAEALAEARRDRRALGTVCAYMTDYLRLTGQSEEAVACGDRALAFADELGDFTLQVLANMLLGHACHAVADYQRAIQLLRRNVRTLSGDLIRERFGSAALPSVFSRSFLAFSLVDLGEFAEAIAMSQEALRIAEEFDTAHSQVIAAHSLGLVYLCKGDLDRAIPVLEETLRRCQVGHIPLGSRLLASALGYAYALSGRVADAVPLLEQALEQAQALKVVFRYALWLAWLSEAYLLSGRLEDAQQAAQRAIDSAVAHKERGHLACALRVMGEVDSRRDPADRERAVGRYREALALAESLGMRPLQAQCQLGLGRAYRGAGRLKEARAELAAATALFRSLDMPLWSARSEAVEAET